MKVNDQNSFSLESAEKKNIFLVPENYFDSLDQKIKNRILELNPSLKTAVLEIPEAYFESSLTSNNQKISNTSILDRPELKGSVFKMPEGYLNTMEDGIRTKLLPERQLGEDLFTVPDRYFETLSEKIQDKIGEKDNVIKFDFASETVVRYAVAASVALVLIASSLFFILRNREENQMAQIKADDLFAKVLIASLDKKEVSQYLEKQDEVETHEIIEFASDKKKEKIKIDFEREIISARMTEKERQDIELELNDLDEFEMPTDI